jgi:hypothetical protein
MICKDATVSADQNAIFKPAFLEDRFISTTAANGIAKNNSGTVVSPYTKMQTTNTKNAPAMVHPRYTA